jgi:hypothetical protein
MGLFYEDMDEDDLEKRKEQALLANSLSMVTIITQSAHSYFGSEITRLGRTERRGFACFENEWTFATASQKRRAAQQRPFSG